MLYLSRAKTELMWWRVAEPSNLNFRVPQPLICKGACI
jgi:hypothetical protein